MTRHPPPARRRVVGALTAGLWSALAVVLVAGLVAYLAPRLASRRATRPDSGAVTLDQQLPSSSTTPTTRTRTTAAAAPRGEEGEPVVLRGDGLGAVAFGAPVDEVIAALTLRWGPPNSDTGWAAAGSASFPFAKCPGNEVRAVEWQGFWVLFSDGPTPHGPAGRRHFFSWYYLAADRAAPRPDPGGNRPTLRTAEGISVGAGVIELRRAYGERLELFDEAPEGPSFGVQTRTGGLFGNLTSVEDSGRAWSLVGGGGCGD